MDSTQRVSVIGDGGWGTTLAMLLHKKGCGVTLWGAFPDYVEHLRHQRENTKFLPGVRIPEDVHITADLDEAVAANTYIVFAVPSQHMRSVMTRLSKVDLNKKKLVSVTKGIENVTLKTMSQLIVELLGRQTLAVLSGPTIALEVVNGIPTTAVAASDDLAFARAVQDLFITDRFRVYAADDMMGVELGGSLKNIIAISAGICDGLGFGTNAKAALLTRGLVEMVRLGAAMGAKRETFYGLSGLGDLATTCMSQYSRNRWLGEEVGRGKKLKEILQKTEMVVEGVATAKSAYELAKKYNIEMPITAEIYRVLYEHKDPKIAVHELMTRSPKVEGEY